VLAGQPQICVVEVAEPYVGGPHLRRAPARRCCDRALIDLRGGVLLPRWFATGPAQALERKRLAVYLGTGTMPERDEAAIAEIKGRIREFGPDHMRFA
jgi:hypothetical protein